MRSFYLLLFSLVNLVVALGQKEFVSHIHLPDSTKFESNSDMHRLASGILADDLKEIIYTLAHDSMEGRELGHEGNVRASNFIAGQLKHTGIKACPGINSYFQDIAFTWVSWNELKCNINGTDYRHLWDYVCLAHENNDLKLETDEIVFLGYGIDDDAYSDYKNIDLKNKTIIIYNGEPQKKNGYYYISKSTSPSPWSSDIQLKLAAAKKHGVKLVLIIEDKMKALIDANRNNILSPKVLMGKPEETINPLVNFMHISSAMTLNILAGNQKKVIKWRNKINKKGIPLYGTLPCKFKVTQTRNIRQAKGRNILSYFEGTDKKEELIIISAHYDHIGKRGDDVFNGADDNASGTSALLEIAKTLKENISNGITPRRSILCLWLTGEEKGLLGSEYYVNHAVFPLSNTMVNINVDMIGRYDEIYLDTTKNYVYVIGSDRLSMDLHHINEGVNNQFSQLILDYTYNSEKDPNRYYYRSDHYNFAENGIPAIFFFSGTHADYHRTTDDADKINFLKTEQIARHIFHLAWALANREETIRLNKQ